MRISCGPANVLEGQRPGVRPTRRTAGLRVARLPGARPRCTAHALRAASFVETTELALLHVQGVRGLRDAAIFCFSCMLGVHIVYAPLVDHLEALLVRGFGSTGESRCIVLELLERRQGQTLRGRLEDRDRCHSARVVACRGQSLERSAPAHRGKERVFGYRGWAPVLR
jgi:hypothetical protein